MFNPVIIHDLKANLLFRMTELIRAKLVSVFAYIDQRLKIGI